MHKISHIHDLQIFNTSLAVLLSDLSSELTNCSAILANYLLFSEFNFNGSILLIHEIKLTLWQTKGPVYRFQ
jgi:hypothetical protein